MQRAMRASDERYERIDERERGRDDENVRILG